MPTISAHGSGKRAVWIGSAVVLAILLLLACLYRRYLLSGLDLVAAGTGGRTSAALCLVLALLVLLWLLVWLLFPVFVYFGLRDLRRRTAELDRTMKLWAQSLERSAAERPATKVEDKTGQRGPGAGSC